MVHFPIALVTLWRWLAEPGWTYLGAAFVVLGLTFYQGWLGSKLVFRDGVGVGPTGQTPARVAPACEMMDVTLVVTPFVTSEG